MSFFISADRQPLRRWEFWKYKIPFWFEEENTNAIRDAAQRVTVWWDGKYQNETLNDNARFYGLEEFSE